MINIIEIFGGIGAFTTAVKRQNIKHNLVNYIELDKHAVNAFNALNDTDFKPQDINNVDMSKYSNIDILVAGWPCQDYSVAGKGLGLEGTRSNLILLTISKIKEMAEKPKYILLENVKGLLSEKHKNDIDYIKQLFNEMGYSWSQALLNSKYFNVPQSRERVYMLLTRNDLPKKDISHLEKKFQNVNKILADVLDYSEPTQSVEVKELLNNLEGRRLWKTNKYIGIIPAGSLPKIYFMNTMKNYKGKDIELDLDKLENQERNKINKVAMLGEVNFNQDKNFLGVKGQSPTLVAQSPDFKGKIMFKEHSFNQKKHFLGIDGITKTLRAGDCDAENKIMFNSNMIIHYRKLSALECWRLMGFSDDDYKKVAGVTKTLKNGKEKALISDSQMKKQAGNSIVVNVLEEIVKVIESGNHG